MQSFKKILTYKLVVLGLLFSLMTPAIAEIDISVREALAEQGDVIAQINMGSIYKNGKGVPKDNHKAFNWFKRASDQGDALAQANLGMMYYEGLGVRQDYTLARKLFQKSANQGDSDAQGILGAFYENGIGDVRQNKSIAKEWYGKSCDNGNQNGCDDYRRLNQK